MEKFDLVIIGAHNGSGLEELILKLRDQGFKEFIISVNYLSDKITNYFKNGK